MNRILYITIMNSEDKKPIISLLGTISLFIAYYFISGMSDFQSESTTEVLQFWSTALLIMIPVLIAGKIILFILFSILYAIFTGDENFDFKRDEFGRLIESRATRNFYNVFIVGFFASMGALALGYSPIVMFNILFFSMLAGGIVLDVSEMYYSRKGI